MGFIKASCMNKEEPKPFEYHLVLLHHFFYNKKFYYIIDKKLVLEILLRTEYLKNYKNVQ